MSVRLVVQICGYRRLSEYGSVDLQNVLKGQRHSHCVVARDPLSELGNRARKEDGGQ